MRVYIFLVLLVTWICCDNSLLPDSRIQVLEVKLVTLHIDRIIIALARSLTEEQGIQFANIFACYRNTVLREPLSIHQLQIHRA